MATALELATARDSITYTFHNKRALLKNYNDTNVYKLQDPQIHIESGTPPTIRNLVVSYLELFNRNRRDLPQEIVLRFENSREATEDENAIASNHIGSTVLVYDFEKNNYINLDYDQIMEFHEPIDLKDLVYTVSAVPDSSRSAYSDLSFRDSVLSDDTNLMAVPHKMKLHLDQDFDSEDWDEYDGEVEYDGRPNIFEERVGELHHITIRNFNDDTNVQLTRARFLWRFPYPYKFSKFSIEYIKLYDCDDRPDALTMDYGHEPIILPHRNTGFQIYSGGGTGDLLRPYYIDELVYCLSVPARHKMKLVIEDLQILPHRMLGRHRILDRLDLLSDSDDSDDEVTQQVPAQPAPRREPPPQRKPNSEDEPVDDDTKMFDASCTVCMIHKKQVFFRPCGHMAACFTCSERLTACPLCKVNIDSKDRVFY